MPTSFRRGKVLVFAVVLLLCFWVSRVAAIDRFPLFIDETIHINLSEQGYETSPLIYADLGRVFTGWWHMLFQTHAAAPAWTARVATLLAVLPGIAASIAIAQRMVGFWGIVFTGLLYFFSTYHFFYERLALADPLSSSAVLVATYFSFRLSHRLRYRDAVLTGIVLFIAFGIKVSIVPYFGVPIAAALTLHNKDQSWWKHSKWALAAVATTLILCLLLVAGLRLRGYDLLSNSFSYAATSRQQATAEVLAVMFSFNRISQNAVNTLNALTVYSGSLAMVICGAFVTTAVVRRRFFLPLCLFGPSLALWISQPQELRYWITFIGLLYLCVGTEIAKYVQRKRPLVHVTITTMILTWGALQWVPFALNAALHPEELLLPSVDRAQYIESDASGFGLREANSLLQEYRPKQIIGMVSNCQGLRYMSPNPSTILCPRINPNGSEIPNLTRLLNESQKQGWFVILESSPYVPDNAPGELLTIIARPGGRIRLSIYALGDSLHDLDADS